MLTQFSNAPRSIVLIELCEILTLVRYRSLKACLYIDEILFSATSINYKTKYKINKCKKNKNCVLYFDII